jgi:hypothetical protein
MMNGLHVTMFCFLTDMNTTGHDFCTSRGGLVAGDFSFFKTQPVPGH